MQQHGIERATKKRKKKCHSVPIKISARFQYFRCNYIYFFYCLSNVDERIVARGMPEMNILNNVSGCINACTGKGVKLRCNETTMKKKHLAPKCLNIYK